MTDARQLRRWRVLVLVGLGLFGLSVDLLLTASTSPAEIPGGTITSLGALDVGTAFAVVIIGWLIYARGAPLVGSFARRLSYGIATVLPAAMLVAMWLFQARLRWNVLLPGLAWRTYVLLQTLPPAIALWRPGAGEAALVARREP